MANVFQNRKLNNVYWTLSHNINSNPRKIAAAKNYLERISKGIQSGKVDRNDVSFISKFLDIYIHNRQNNSNFYITITWELEMNTLIENFQYSVDEFVKNAQWLDYFTDKIINYYSKTLWVKGLNGFFSNSYSSSFIKNEIVQQKILSKIDLNAFGDAAVERFNTEGYNTSEMEYLSLLGYDITKRIDIAMCYQKQETFNNQEIVSKMYHYQFELLKEKLEAFQKKEITEDDWLSFLRETDKHHVPTNAVPLQTDTMACYWWNFNKAVNSNKDWLHSYRDAMYVAFSELYEYAKKFPDRQIFNGDLFNQDEIPTEKYFNDISEGLPLYYLLDGYGDNDEWLDMLMFNRSKLNPRNQFFVDVISKLKDNHLSKLQRYCMSNYKYFQEGCFSTEFYDKALTDESMYSVLKLIDPNFLNKYSIEEQQYLILKEKYAKIVQISYSKEQIKEYFNENGFSDLFYNDMLLKQPEVINKILPTKEEKLKHYPLKEVQYLEIAIKYHVRFTSEQISVYFDENGLSKEGVSFFWKEYNIDALKDQDHHILKKALNDLELYALQTYFKMDVQLNTKKIFMDYFRENEQDMTFQKIDNLVTLVTRISLSNSASIQHMQSELLKQLISLENPESILEKIEDVYLKNHLPEVAKLFIVFQILNSKEIFNNILNSKSSPNLLSKSYRGCQTILFSDLLKCSLASNNRSMKKYIYNIEEGQKILGQVMNGTNMSTLDKEQQELLSTYFMNLNALYNNTQKGKLYSNELSGNIERDLLGLIKLFLKTEDIHKLPDQIVKMYGHFAGFDTFKDLKEYMKSSIEKADKRNRERAQENHFAISKGDFIKGLGLSNDKYYFLKNILQNGSVCKEFLGSAASSDTTPFDTDVSKITEDNPSFEVFSSRYVASLYGPLWIVLKNDERFHETSENDNSYDPNKLEVFLTGGGDHYGIRTGFPSSAIDFFVVDESQIKLDRIKYEIVMNGFYIPVVSTEEKLLFTPDEYDRLHQEMMGLSYYGTESEYVFAKELEHFTLTEEQRIAQVNTQEEVLDYRREFVETLKKAGLPIVTERDSDLSSPVLELLDTGSTGRGTNKVSDYDFDFIIRVNRNVMMNEEKKNELLQKIHIAFPDIVITDNLIRDTVITLPSGRQMKIDITFIVKTDKLDYSTDECIKDRLRTIRDMSEEKYQKVLANIVMAKEVLKDVYKPRHAGKNPQGGLGGVGIENWILQNGGSFEHAAREFIRVSENKSFEEFAKEYAVWDFGENHLSFRKSDGYMHDNFVKDNMTEEGYNKMKEVLKEYLRSLEQERELTTDHAMHL